MNGRLPEPFSDAVRRPLPAHPLSGPSHRPQRIYYNHERTDPFLWTQVREEGWWYCRAICPAAKLNTIDGWRGDWKKANGVWTRRWGLIYAKVYFTVLIFWLIARRSGAERVFLLLNLIPSVCPSGKLNRGTTGIINFKDCNRHSSSSERLPLISLGKAMVCFGHGMTWWTVATTVASHHRKLIRTVWNDRMMKLHCFARCYLTWGK